MADVRRNITTDAGTTITDAAGDPLYVDIAAGQAITWREPSAIRWREPVSSEWREPSTVTWRET